jgi:Xaa-Pro dipeptidase
MKNRIKKIFGYVQHDLDAIVIQNSTAPFIDLSFFYVTGFENGLFENCIVVLYPDGEMEILTSHLEKENIKATHYEVFENKAQRDDLLQKKLGKRMIGVNFSCLSHEDFRGLQKKICQDLTDIGDAIQHARLIKDTKEIKYIKKACKISSDIATGINSLFNDEISEQEIASEIVYQIYQQGGSIAFNPIVAFGKNTACPHYSYGEKKLTRGPALYDFGAKYKRYCSDITRTFYNGNPPAKFLKMYKVVFDAQQTALDLIKPGVPMAKVHDEVNAFIRNNGYGNIIHSTGHSLGLAVHDGSVLHNRSQMILSEGMVFTVEPGIYIPGYGGVRIEDDILVTKEGVELLTRAHREIDRMIV